MRGARTFPILRDLYGSALATVDPERAVRRALSLSEIALALRRRRVGVFAVGKAAAGMFRAARNAGRESLVVVPKGERAPRRPHRSGVEVLFASHPEPDSSSVEAARAAVRFFSRFGPEDVILCLVSGGTSSLLCLPRADLTLREKKSAVRRLIASGAPITRVNRLRAALSAVKGGKLGRATRARLVTLVLSDVPGDVPELVGSGPTVRGRSGDVVRVIGSNRAGLEAAAHAARRLGLRPRRSRLPLRGEAREAGRVLGERARRLAPGEVLVAGGETTVSLTQRRGTGGRNLEVALAAAIALEGSRDAALLAVASDGRDGSSRAAGAFVDGRTIGRARARGLDPLASLSRHDTEAFFERAGGLLVTGSTGTNVADWVFAVRVGKRKTENGKR